jgi:hypothetical protein
MLQLWLMTQQLQDKPNVVFQHDLAHPHTHREVTILLNWKLPERRQRRVHFWTPRSPDLTPLEFFLWDFVKNGVHVPPMTVALNNLKDRARTGIAKTDQPLMQNVWHDVEYRPDVSGQ